VHHETAGAQTCGGESADAAGSDLDRLRSIGSQLGASKSSDDKNADRTKLESLCALGGMTEKPTRCAAFMYSGQRRGRRRNRALSSARLPGNGPGLMRCATMILHFFPDRAHAPMTGNLGSSVGEWRRSLSHRTGCAAPNALIQNK